MGKMKYVKFKEVCRNAKDLSKNLDMSSFNLMIDIFKCAFKYGSSVKDYVNFEFYLLNQDERSSYLTDFYYDKVLERYASSDFVDKIKFYNLFKEFLYRDFLDLRNVSFKDFKDFILNKEKIVVRCIDGTNTDIILIDKSKLKNEYNVLKIYNNIMKKEQFIIEDSVMIDKEKTIYSDNFRVTCFVDENNEFNVLEVIVKNGDKYAKLNQDGEIVIPFIDSNDNVTHKDIIGVKVPNYEEIINFVKNLTVKISNGKYMSFDVAVINESLVFVDVNNGIKSFQPKPSVSGVRNGDLILYRKYMDL